MRRILLFALLGLASCEGLFGVDFDDVKARPTQPLDAAGPDAAVDADAGRCANDVANGCGTCTPCPTAENGGAVCEEQGCAIACNRGFRRCSSGCCASREAPVAAGTTHTCATARSGALYCWGYNASGQLGDSTKETRETPVLVSNLEGGARDVAVGIDFTIATAPSSTIFGWGANRFGTLGDGTTTARLTAWPVESLRDEWAYVVAAAWHSCAVSRTGRASCWGYNVSGVVGTGTTASEVLSPVRLVQEEPFTTLSTSSAHACAVGVSGALYCWGNNASGQLGVADKTLLAPTRIPFASDGDDDGAVVVATGSDHTCVATRAGAVKCWGSNVHGQLGIGDKEPRATAVTVLPTSAAVRQIAAGDSYTCVVSAAGAVSCWGNVGTDLGVGNGSPNASTLPVPVAVGGGVASLSAGAKHACARLFDGRVRCWGANTAGQLGDGTRTPRLTPVDALLPN